MVISQPPGNNPSYYYRASPTRSLFECFPETPLPVHKQQHQVTRNGAIKHINESDPRSGSSADCSLFILSLHALALHLAVKILLQIFQEDLSTLVSYTSVGCISLQNASRTALCYATNTIK